MGWSCRWRGSRMPDRHGDVGDKSEVGLMVGGGVHRTGHSGVATPPYGFLIVPKFWRSACLLR